MAFIGPQRIWPWALLVLAGLPSALVHPPTLPSPVIPHATLQIATLRTPAVLDPARAQGVTERMVVDNIFQPLMRITSGGALSPDLAKSVTIHGSTIQMVLKKARLSNGQAVTASVVASALARPLWPSVHSLAAQAALKGIVGVSAVWAGKTPFIKGVAVTGTNSLSIQLKTPGQSSGLLRNLASSALRVVPASDLIRGGSYWQLTNLIGSGGWRLVQWSPDNRLGFAAVAARSGPASVEIVQYGSLGLAESQVVNGSVDLLALTPTQVASLPVSWRNRVRFLPEPTTINLYRKTGEGVGIRVNTWVTQAFGRQLRSISNVRIPPTAAKSGTTLWVNASDPLAVVLANSLAKLRPVQVQVVNSTQLAAAAKVHQIGMYLGTQNLVGGGAHATAVVPQGQFWMVSPDVVSLTGNADGIVRWNTVRWGASSS